ncbi:MAG: hypothetical protein HXX12_16155 [Geothrix sp.]|uniref:hypothetical protein n=1 Tax=Geothrix sp. TaxID=1962974 RepID=UPI0017F703EA|nr:hypothetical protein [Geothrix sp.]NWJ42495.1 hypothetical protein [Geothrix sp.]WIL19543.1 MAG: hypothetical protein QOZ81_002063 [Geothrix sp.]
MLTLLILDELTHLRRSRLIQVVLVCVALLMPIALLASRDHVQVIATMLLTLTALFTALLTGSVVTASLTSDLQQGVPILFAIRPVPRAYFLLARGAGMAIILTATLCVGVGALFLVNAALARLPLDAAALFRILLLMRIPGILLAMACGLLIGVLSEGIPSSLAGFMFLTCVLSFALDYAATKVSGWFGWSPAAGEILHLALVLFATATLILEASRRFSKKPI